MKDKIKIEKRIKIMQDYINMENSQVQWKDSFGNWKDEDYPSFSLQIEWRIKPEPRKLYVAYEEGSNLPKYMHENKDFVLDWIRRFGKGYRLEEFIQVTQ